MLLPVKKKLSVLVEICDSTVQRETERIFLLPGGWNHFSVSPTAGRYELFFLCGEPGKHNCHLYAVSVPQLHKGRSPQLHTGRSPPFHTGRSPQLHTDRSPQLHTDRSPQLQTGKSPQFHTGRSPQLHTAKVTPTSPLILTSCCNNHPNNLNHVSAAHVNIPVASASRSGSISLLASTFTHQTSPRRKGCRLQG